MSSPFGDPDLRAQMEKMGVAHKPGMADELMRELAPLLKADGVDLDDLGDTDLETLNAALARAQERRNLELLTPIGAQRTSALATLRVFTAAIAEHQDTLAKAIIESVEPEATAPAASVSHVIGTALGLLDEWYADDALRPSLRGARTAPWHRKHSRTVASDLLALAPKGRAFDSNDGLIRRYGGLAVLEGAALAVAAAMIAVADADGAPLDEIAERMLQHGGSRGDASPQHPSAPGSAFRKPDAQPGAAFRRPAAPGAADHRLQNDFARWLEASGVESATEARESGLAIVDLLNAMRRIRLDLNDPDDFEAIVDAIFDWAETAEDEDADDLLVAHLDLLHDYVHFRIDSGDPDAWATAHVTVETARNEVDGGVPFDEIIAEDEGIPDEERLAAFLQLPLVTGVSALLEWIGGGRPITPSGVARRADIEEVAGFLGIKALGVARLDQSVTPDGVRRVQSMMDLPELHSWWQALRICDLIEISATRVRPGPAVESWLAGPSFEDAQKLIAMFIVNVVGAEEGVRRIDGIGSGMLLHELAIALEPELGANPMNPFAAAVGRARMRLLVALGLAEEPINDTFEIPRLLRGTIARGLLTSMAVATAMDDADAADWE